jgi:hypothetical protein
MSQGFSSFKLLKNLKYLNDAFRIRYNETKLELQKDQFQIYHSKKRHLNFSVLHKTPIKSDLEKSYLAFKA